MRKSILFILLLLPIALMAQVGIGTTTPDASAKLDVTSTTKGFLPPRMLANERAAIASPAEGLMVYQTDGNKGLYYYNGTNWIFIIPTNISGNAATATLATTVTTNANLTGDVTSVGNATTIANGAITNSKVTDIAASKITGTLPVTNGGTGTTNGSITGTTALTLAAGGTNQNVILTPSGTGNSLLNGNVGVGPTAPSSYPGYTSMAISNATSGGVLDFLNGSNRVGTIYNDASKFLIGSVGATTNTIPLVFITGGSASERMRITGTGNVGIATNNPTNILEVNGSGGTGTGLKLPTGAGANKLLSSDASGNASWATNLAVHSIGESYDGGIVFFVYDNGRHGLIAATSDQSTSIKWNAGAYTDTMALANGVGAGLKNTAIIIANQGYGNGISYAARVCNEYYVNISGVYYGDWYLPSQSELSLLYNQRSVVGSFSTGNYWSSWESTDPNHPISSAWALNFSDNTWNWQSKSNSYYVRAIKAF